MAAIFATRYGKSPGTGLESQTGERNQNRGINRGTKLLFLGAVIGGLGSCPLYRSPIPCSTGQRYSSASKGNKHRWLRPLHQWREIAALRAVLAYVGTVQPEPLQRKA